MALNDVYSVTLVSQYEGVTMNNTFYAQTVVSNDASLELTELLTLAQFKWVGEVKKFCADSVQWTNIIARRLKPAMTDVRVLDINTNGDLPSVPLPSTCYALFRYYCTPYEAEQSNHFKIGGLTTAAQNRGVISDEILLLMSDFISEMTQSPFVAGQNSFAFVRPPKDTDIAGNPLPTIYKMFVDSQMRNLRGRQLY